MTRSTPDRSLWVAVLATGLLLSNAAGCDRDPPPPLPGQIEQPAAAVTVGERLFLASPPSDGIRVLDLEEGRDSFVRAPNPLFALEVPAVRRPTILKELPSREPDQRDLLVAASSVDQQLRLIDAEALTPLGRPIALPGRPVAMDVGRQDEADVLLVAVAWPRDSDSPGALVAIDLSPDARERDGTLGFNDSPVRGVETIDLDVVPGGLAVSESEGELRVWVSDLAAPRVMRIEFGTGDFEEIDTGEPLSTLVSSPEAISELVTTPRGRFVYGLTADGKGVIALDDEWARVAELHVFDDEARSMPLPSRGVALTVALRVMVDVGEGDDARAVQVPFLLLVATVDGGVLYFDGATIAPVDTEGRLQPEPSARLVPAANLPGEDGYTSDVDWSAPVLETEENPDFVLGGDEPPLLPIVELTPGVSRTRTWRISWRNELPGHSSALGLLETIGDDVRVVPVFELLEQSRHVHPGDRLSIKSKLQVDAPGCGVSGVPEELLWEVAAVDPDGAMTLSVIEGGASLPEAACFAAPLVYGVRAGGYMVVADGIDEAWRLEPGDSFEYDGERFMHTEPSIDGPEVAFTLGAVQDEAYMEEGAERELRVHLGLEPIRAFPDTMLLQISRPAVMGQPAAYRPSVDAYGTGRLFVPYAGSDYIVSFDLKTRGRQRVYR